MLINRLERIGRTFHHAQRFRDIVRVFLKYGYEDVAHRLHLPSSLGLPTRHRREEQAAIHQLSPPEKLRRACEELGTTFIKMGQILSTRPNLLPPGFAEELAKLQDGVAPVSFPEVQSVLRAELKCPLEEVFQSIEEKPLGSAFIAQVHRARLVAGDDVVVKVQRPGIRKVIAVDLEIVGYLAALMKIISTAGRSITRPQWSGKSPGRSNRKSTSRSRPPTWNASDFSSQTSRPFICRRSIANGRRRTC